MKKIIQPETKWVMKEVLCDPFDDELEINKIILDILRNRYSNLDEIKAFLNNDYEQDIHDPFLFSQMTDVVDLIISHIRKRNKILVYGDYDVDGVTSSVILIDILKLFKANVDYYIPDRVEEGYGLNKKAIDDFSQRGIDLIITVDLGIRNKAEVKQANDLGMDIIITDHHDYPENETLPDCLILNPKLKNEKYPFKFLAGVGVAFKLATALIEKSKIADNLKERLSERLVDLCAIGSIADCVPLFGENRLLVQKGLNLINKKTRLGLQELISISRGKNNNLKEIGTYEVGFQISPRINAAGRMDSALEAVELLLSDDPKKASKLAESLDKKNQERKKVTENIINTVKDSIENEDQTYVKTKKNDKIIIGVNYDDSWQEGVIGLVAGRIMEKYYKPVIIITKTKDEYKGSGRSVSDFNIIENIELCKEFLEKYGGHPAACGFSLKENNLDDFLEQIKKFANQQLVGKELIPKLEIDTKINLEDINQALLDDLKKLEPYGSGNSLPIFMSENLVIRDIMFMGNEDQHIKIRFDHGLWGLRFNILETYKKLYLGAKINLAYTLEENNFNGKKEIILKIRDLELISE